jgi:hypothetical protein
MSDVTQILNAIAQGDPHAAEQLLPLGIGETAARSFPLHRIRSFTVRSFTFLY